MEKTELKKLKRQACLLRQAVVAMLATAGSGHPASCLDSAEIFTWLYQQILQKNPKNPEWEDRDYFLLSAGHLAPTWYAALSQAGYFSAKLLPTLRKFGSPLQGHPHRDLTLGIENSAGPLGQGVSQAAGIAYDLQQKQKAQRVFVLSSDGEQQEGQVWEAYLFAANYNLQNLTVIIDQNKIQQSGKTSEVMDLDNLLAKLLAFGFAATVVDGNSFTSLTKGWQQIEKQTRPKALICQTIPGKGVSFIEGDYHWHAKSLSKDEAKVAVKELEARC